MTPDDEHSIRQNHGGDEESDVFSAHRLTRASAQPSFAPLFAAAEESCPVRWLTVCYRTLPDALDSVLPGTLRCDPANAQVAFWVAEFTAARFRAPDGTVATRPSYLQGGVSVRCLRAGQPGAYALLTFIEGLNHGLLGRELFGLPKKQARRVYLDEQRVDLVGTQNDRHPRRLQAGFVTAGGLNLAHIDVDFTDQSPVSSSAFGCHPWKAEGAEVNRAEQARSPTCDARGVGSLDPLPAWFATHYTHKLIPSAEGNGFDVSRLVRIPWRTSRHRNTVRGTAEVQIADSPFDPLYLLPIQGSRRCPARYGSTVLDISFGRYVEHLDNPETFPTYGIAGW